MCFGSVMSAFIAGVNSVQDIRKKEIFLLPTILSGLAGIFYSVYSGSAIWEILSSLIPGMLILALSVISGGKVGLGDAIVVSAIGMWLDMYTVFYILIGALLPSGAVSGVYLLKGYRNKEIPFVPFIFIGCILNIFFRIIPC